MPASSNIRSKGGESTEKSKSGKSVGMMLFGFIFFAAGFAVAAFTVGSNLLRYYETEDWARVPATITSLDLRTHHGDDSVTWSVEAHYQYQFNGRTYYSDSVALTGGSDNIGDFWQVLYSRLKSEQQRNQVHAYVNPADPQEAYLDRTLRMGLMVFGGIFGAVFMAVGGAVMFMGGRSSNVSDQADRAREGIPSDQRGSYKILLFIGCLFVLISAPLLFIIVDALQDGEPEVLLGLIFPLVGSGAIYAALRMRKRYLQIGQTLFYPDPLPGHAGGQVGGYFHLASGEWVTSPQVRLTCVHIYSTGSGKESKTHHDVIWQSKGRAHCEPNNSGCNVHALFDVPADLPGSGSPSGYRGRIQWNLHCDGIVSVPVAAARNPRVDNSRAMRDSNRLQVEFERSWSIPVEKGQQTSSFQMPAEEQEAWNQQQREDAHTSAAAQIAMTAAGSGLHLESAAGRHTGMALGLLVFGLIFDCVGVFLFFMAAQGELMLWLMAPVFLLVGLLVTWLGVFWLGRGLEADVEPGRVRVVRRLFGIALYQRSAEINAASPLTLDMGMSSSNQNGISTEYFSLQVEAGGKKIKLAEGIEGREAAEALKEKVRAVLTRELDSELI
jgi:hypothetical protein